MLSYAFRILNEQGYKKIETEEFCNVADLCAAILVKSVTTQLKRGLHQAYMHQYDALSTLRGKIEYSESITSGVCLQKKWFCTYDEYMVNTKMNQIIKTTFIVLLHAKINPIRKKEIKKILVYFSEIDEINVHTIDWKIQYHKNNQTYQLIHAICYLVLHDLLQTQQEGTLTLMDYMDEQSMAKLYERFIFEYYRKEHLELKVSAPYISWQLDDAVDTMLPIMKTDVMLSKGDKFVIIDAKYYTKTLQDHFNVKTIHSSNLYQIFTYVKNKEIELAHIPHVVSGILLYAKTDESVYPQGDYQMSGNNISVKTLDLNSEFTEITIQLDEIVTCYFKDEIK